MNDPLVSIIINCYNGEEFLKEAIDSIYDQTYKNWEIIFWDNASTDKSSEIANSYDSKIRYFYTPINTNLGRARNCAIRKAKGDFISFLDCDDIYLPNKITVQINHMLKNNLAMSYGGWARIDDTGYVKKEYFVKPFFGDYFDKFLHKYDVNFQTVMFNKRLVPSNIFCFDESLKFSPDYKLIMSVAFYCKNIMSVNELLSKYRVHNNSLSSSNKKTKLYEFDRIVRYFKDNNMHLCKSKFDFLMSRYKYKMIMSDLINEGKYYLFLKKMFKYIGLLILNKHVN